MTEENCIALAAQSNVLYSDLLATLKEIAKTSGTDQNGSSLEKQLAACLHLQQQIAAHDDRLNTAIQALDHIPEHLDVLLQQKEALLNETIRSNASLVSQAETMKSLLAEELKKIKSGHTALRGYQGQGSSPHGGFRRSL